MSPWVHSAAYTHAHTHIQPLSQSTSELFNFISLCSLFFNPFSSGVNRFLSILTHSTVSFKKRQYETLCFKANGKYSNYPLVFDILTLNYHDVTKINHYIFTSKLDQRNTSENEVPFHTNSNSHSQGYTDRLLFTSAVDSVSYLVFLVRLYGQEWWFGPVQSNVSAIC